MRTVYGYTALYIYVRRFGVKILIGFADVYFPSSLGSLEWVKTMKPATATAG